MNKKLVVVAGVFFSATCFLGGCNTVKGTAHGAARDAHAVARAVDPGSPPARRKAHHHAQHAAAQKGSNLQPDYQNS